MRLRISPRWRPADWRIGVYVERGTLADEVGFLVLAPLPMLSLLFALYRREAWEGSAKHD